MIDVFVPKRVLKTDGDSTYRLISKIRFLRIVILRRIYSEFQKYPNWGFLAFKSLNDSLSVEVGRCLDS